MVNRVMTILLALGLGLILGAWLALIFISETVSFVAPEMRYHSEIGVYYDY